MKSKCALIGFVATIALGGAANADPLIYEGICDASAAVALDSDRFVVGNDEDNTLRVYRQGQPRAVASISLDALLDTHKETDIEGAALVGTRVYWITSHGRNKDGEAQERRHRFFATDIVKHDGELTVEPAEAAYAKLLDDLIDDDRFAPFKLREASEKAPEAAGGLNIEGLAAWGDGDVLVGFRNPIRNGQALAIPLENPGKVTEGKKAKFGDAIELDLDGRGIRSIERVGSGYLIVAGPPADDGDFALYRWSGQSQEVPVKVEAVTFTDLHPEALFAVPGGNVVRLLSDDGGVVTDGVRCKDQPEANRSFRSIDLEP